MVGHGSLGIWELYEIDICGLVDRAPLRHKRLQNEGTGSLSVAGTSQTHLYSLEGENMNMARSLPISPLLACG